MNPIEESLRRLVAMTTMPPPSDAPVDQLLALAEAVALERQPVFEEMSAMLQKGTRLTEVARALVAQLERADRVWHDRLDSVRSRLESQRAQSTAPRGRISAYLAR